MEEPDSEEPLFGSDDWHEKYHEPAIVVYDVFKGPMPPGFKFDFVELFRHLNKPPEEGEFDDLSATPEKSE
ncbi:MAG: hypothetical protein WC761_06225 [Candidatus Paceibacterota bacterium]|jgi:hypothetical protein